MIRITSFRNFALTVGLAAVALLGGSGCAAPTGNDSIGQSDDEVRHAHVVGVDGSGWDNGANGYADGEGPMAMPVTTRGFSRSPSPEPWRASPDDSPSPEPWDHSSIPPADDGSSGGGGSSGENPHPNSMAPSTK